MRSALELTQCRSRHMGVAQQTLACRTHGNLGLDYRFQLFRELWSVVALTVLVVICGKVPISRLAIFSLRPLSSSHLTGATLWRDDPMCITSGSFHILGPQVGAENEGLRVMQKCLAYLGWKGTRHCYIPCKY